MDLKFYNADPLNDPRNLVDSLPEMPELDMDDIHIWTVSFNLPDNLVADLEILLSRDEIKKANSFQFPYLKRQYIVFHATLKKILGSYLGLKEIAFEHGPYGKPAVSEKINPDNIRFNMSKSSETGVYTFMLQNEVGIDIEKVAPLTDMGNIVNRHFSEKEKCIYQELPKEEKLNWFYTIWTRKEALLKAIGTGLNIPLEEIDVAHVDNIKVDSELYDRDAQTLNMTDFTVVNGFKSAICTSCN